ncbi:dystrophin isoform X8 [Apis mellifera carnica]|nr:dystrophin isoform X8 [Apis mellifera carnica]
MIKYVTDEREDVQKKTFAKWINSQLLKNHHEPISDLFVDLRDGNRLLSLLEVLTSKVYKRERGRMRVHHLNNVNKALQILEQNNVKLVNISSNDIVDGNPKLTLGLVWSIILHWQVHYHLKDLMTELQQTNLEKTLLAWCRQNSQNYSGVDIKNFTTSWSDGLAFNAILHKWKPHLFDFNNIARKHPNARLDHAFRIAQEQLGIERLLDPEDVNTSVPDKKSIMMYVMCLFQSLPHSGDDIGELDLSVASDSSPVTTPGAENTLSFTNFGTPTSRPMSLATNVSVELGGYQVALEEVLTWLLEAEDKLNHAPDPGSTLEVLKQQFHEHESFLVELSGHQDGVGAVLEEGARLLAEGGLHKDEEHEVRVQMSLLNSRWEGLRMRAMERQTKIHEVLMQMQQGQLDALRQWLTRTEDRISRMAAIELNQSALDEQLKQLNELEQDIEAQQGVVDGMRNMVVVVDEENSEAVYAQMEDQLSALGERWTHICQWKEERRQRLQALSSLWQNVNDDYKRLMSWLNETEITLKQMEANPASEIGEVLERIKKLQILKMDMDENQRKLMSLQESIQELEGQNTSPECINILEKIENLQDRWEAVGQIMEVQTQRLEVISHKWNAIVDGAKSLNDKYEDTLKKNDEIINGIEDFTKWLSTLEKEIPIETKITSSVELFQIRGRYQSLKEKIDKRVEEFRNLNEMGNDKLLSSEGSSVQELGRRFTFLNARWTDVTDRIYERYRHLQNASHEYGEFRALVAQESDWLDKLDKRLRRSTERAADAEEISEELDKLMEEMEHQRSTLQEMALQIESYKASGKQEAALRLQEQLTLIEQKFSEVQQKFQRFRCPTNLEPRLSRALRELRGIEEATCLLELSSEDPEAIEGQLKHCLETLTEVIPRLNVVKDKLLNSQDEFSKLCDPMYLEQLKEKLSDVVIRLANTEKRLRLCNASEEEPNVDEIKAWLLQVEEKLNKLDSVPVDQLTENHFEQCKAVQSEMIEAKPKVNQLQRYTYYPKVSDVCKKWEDISNRIQEWIHKITDSLLIKSKMGETKGRDNYGRTKLSRQDQTSMQLAKKENKLIDENEEIYGIGYLNPAFDESQCNIICTPESSPVDIVHRSRKSSAKSEKVKAKIVDVSRTVRRKLDMSSIPDVVQTSQPQVVHIDDDLSSLSPDTDVYMADEEFFLSKNSTLFSQVSSNTLTTTESKPLNYNTQMNPFRIVEVKEIEIIKSVASPEDHVILPSANVSTGLKPQVVERVEIIEDTETEPESVDTDTEDKETRIKVCKNAISNGNQTVNKKRELIPILKKKKIIDSYSAKSVKKLTLKLDVEDTSADNQISNYKPQFSCKVNKFEKNSAWKDKDSIAEYLILEDNEISTKLSSRCSADLVLTSGINSTKSKKELSNIKELTFEKDLSKLHGNENHNNDYERNIKLMLFRRARSISKDDTLEDCESFYGSDKETDDVLIFSDDTEIDVGSSSSEGEDSNSKEHIEHLLGKVLKGEVSTLAPDAAALISKGDGLVMTVHISDPVRAEKIKNEHQDKLRSKWHQVMSEIETRRTQAQRGEEMLRQYNAIITEFEDWFRDVPLKLEQVNNYEGQLESFTVEFDAKQEQIKKLNELAIELKKLNIGYAETIRYSINSRWQEVSSQFKRFSGSKDKDKHVTDKKVEVDVGGVDMQEFTARVNKIREAVANINLSNHRDYVENKLVSLKKYICTLDAIMAWVMETRARINISRELPQQERVEIINNIMTKVEDREMEVKDVLENYTNLEKECESAKQPISVELQEKLKKLREDWQFVKNNGELSSYDVKTAIAIGTASSGIGEFFFPYIKQN